MNCETLHNLAWAINSNVRKASGKYWYKYPIHGFEYNKAVYEGLKAVVEQGIREGLSKAEIRKKIEEQLAKWGGEMESGGHF